MINILWLTATIRWNSHFFNISIINNEENLIFIFWLCNQCKHFLRIFSAFWSIVGEILEGVKLYSLSSNLPWYRQKITLELSYVPTRPDKRMEGHITNYLEYPKSFTITSPSCYFLYFLIREEDMYNLPNWEHIDVATRDTHMCLEHIRFNNFKSI